jgi:hypothetical protein
MAYISLSEVGNAENFSNSWAESTAMKPAASLLHSRQPQIDPVGHRLVAGVRWMQVVARIELRPDVPRVMRVARSWRRLFQNHR